MTLYSDTRRSSSDRRSSFDTSVFKCLCSSPAAEKYCYPPLCSTQFRSQNDRRTRPWTYCPSNFPSNFKPYTSHCTQPQSYHHTMSIDPSLLNTRVLLENKNTERYLFDGNHKLDDAFNTESRSQTTPKLQCAGDNYYGRAYYVIIPTEDGYILENEQTKRWVYSDGEKVTKRGEEQGWISKPGIEVPVCSSSDFNYFSGALWTVEERNGTYLFANKATNRYLFSDGDKIVKHGDEGGGLASSGTEAPDCKGADDNYYNRAQCKIVKV